jgi:hypothetical protein
MIDDRLLRKLPSTRALLPTQLSRIAALPELVWKRTAFVVGPTCDWRELRRDTQLAACTSAGFTQREVFDIGKADPWWITQGDPNTNIELLRALPWAEVTDETLCNMKRLLELEWGDAQLVRTIETLIDIPVTITTVEQAHKSGALFARDHEYSEETLLSRMDLHRLGPMFKLDRVHALQARLRKKVDALLAKQPRKTYGKQAFFGQLSRSVRHDNGATQEEIMGKNVTVMQEHTEKWDQLSNIQRSDWNNRARQDVCINLNLCRNKHLFYVCAIDK